MDHLHPCRRCLNPPAVTATGAVICDECGACETDAYSWNAEHPPAGWKVRGVCYEPVECCS